MSSSATENPLSLKTVQNRFLAYQMLSGTVFAATQFGEVIARKSLGASTFQVTLLTMMMPLAGVSSIWWARLLQGRDQRPFLLIAGSISLLAVISGIVLNSMTHMLLLYVVFFLGNSLVLPARNRILQQHMPAKKHGEMFSITQGARVAMGAVAIYFAGLWMDANSDGFRDLFFISGLLGLAGVIILGTIPPGPYTKKEIGKFDFKQPLIELTRLLKRRKDYLRFEGAFMLYGIAFMMTLPVVPIYLVDELRLDYATIGIAKGAVAQVASVLAIIVAGRWYDKTTPHRFAAIIFIFLALHPLTLLAAKVFAGGMQLLVIYSSYLLWGVGMGGVMLIWNLASIRFAGENEDAGVYQSVHLTAVAIRGLFAPLLGFFVMTYLGVAAALIIAAILWIIASIAMILARKIDFKSGDAVSLRA
ncbi:MFS transporter [bacterium]|nr:MFS transporter [bacterium]